MGMEAQSRGLFDGILFHRKALVALYSSRALRGWYLQNILLSVFFAMLLLAVLFFSGLWAVWEVLSVSQIGLDPTTYDVFVKGLFSVFWFVVMLFVSVILGTQVSSLMLQLLYRENALSKILVQENRLFSVESGSSFFSKSRSHYWKQEFKGTLLSVFVTMFFWPFLLLPPLLPVGVTVFSYVLGLETFASAERVLNEKGLRTYSDGGSRISKSFLLGLGLPMVILGLFPFLGFIVFPMLKISGFLSATSSTQEPRSS